MMKKYLFLLALCVWSVSQAGVTFPGIFNDNMVLQRDIEAPVFGWDSPGQEVTVQFAGQQVKAKADAKGKWMVRLKPLKVNAAGQNLTVTGSSTRTFKNVVVGEVWVCSGQSNMEWTVRGSLNPAGEAKTADYPLIRHIKVSHNNEPYPKETAKISGWVPCSPKTVGNFTAVGYYFARKLHKELNVPIGLIGSNWGGTRVEPWTPPVGFNSIPELKSISQKVDSWNIQSESGQKAFKDYFAKIKDWTAKAEAAVVEGKAPPLQPKMPGPPTSHQEPTKLYNGMIHFMIPFAIRGAIWYQGESNGGEGISYFHKKKALIEGWRKLWNQGDFPFYYVQLANFQAPNDVPGAGNGWARIRMAQTKVMEIPNTGQAVIIDIGEARDIHPKNKQDVGKRLARWALAKDYGKDIVYSGPLYKSHKVEGSNIIVEFNHTGSGLMSGVKEGIKPTAEDASGKLKRFAIAGADKKFYWADAKIVGNTVVLSCKDVPKPVAVRYAYSMNPLGCNLYNKEGLPASPFRTDSW
jgi:sialate O-acetylesterase